MRTIQQLAIPKEVSSDFPHGAILNETDIADGTPVIREIYNDILANVYKLVELTGLTATGAQDSETNGYQVIEALRKLTNVQNDIEQVLGLSGTVWSVPLNLAILPNKYVFFARASDNYNPFTTYTFKGIGATQYPFISTTGFRSGDEIVVIFDTAGVRVYSLSMITQASETINTPMGNPLSYNGGDVMYYFEDGSLLNETPSIYYIQSVIRTFESDSSIEIVEMFILRNKLVCFYYSLDNDQYKFCQFSLSNLNTVIPISYSINNSDNFNPFCYTDGTSIYLTNDANNIADDFELRKLIYDEDAATLIDSTKSILDASFFKTTNVVITSTALISLVGGVLNSFDLISGVKTDLGVYNTISGNLFGFNDAIYFGSGQVAVKWAL